MQLLKKWVENEDVIDSAPLLKDKLEYQYPVNVNDAEDH